MVVSEFELKHFEPRAHVFKHTEYCLLTPSGTPFKKFLALSLPHAQITSIYQLQGKFAPLLQAVNQKLPLHLLLRLYPGCLPG